MSDRKIPFEQISRDEALMVFKQWSEKADKTEY
jgi:hypothetical protein